MRYLGSKIKLLNFIQRTIEKYNIQGHVFCDLTGIFQSPEGILCSSAATRVPNGALYSMP